jgi:tryptophanyl-tRNA synthetase
MTEFKDKSSKISSDRISVGLFNYPVLMAADILLYDASYVPVGDDQRQHLEFTRDIAERFNNRFGDIFTIPKSVKEQHDFFGKDQGLRVMDLHDPTKKMSKSDESGKGVIFLSDDPQISVKKVISATTDDKASINFNRNEQPGISNLLEILALLSHTQIEEVAAKWQGSDNYGAFKKAVADELNSFLLNFQSELQKVDDQKIKDRLQKSEDQLSKTADETLLRAQKAVGLR